MASSSSTSRSLRYDVFPSFSGEDVRKTFLSHLLDNFKRKSIKTFIDNGIARSRSIAPELLLAIGESRISIVVFSKNYASSTWCLNELAEIHKCLKELDQMVIPVFYGVDPSHVTKQSGEFGKAFDETCKGKTEDLIQSWKSALAEIAIIAGYDFQRWDDEAKMIEQISKDVLNKLITPSDDFGDYVGIQTHLDAIMDSKLCLESGGVRMVGIVGPSGIGKTTIARALYSCLSTQFDHRAFVSYRRTNQDKTIADFGMKLAWVKQFLSEILCHKDIKIESLGVVEQRLKHMKVLIVLDDINDLDVLETLVGQTGWFGFGSRIVVVTQDRALLEAHEIDLIYEVEFPSQELALQMFCRSAFKQNSPPDGFTEFAGEVANLVGNLPLGLNVLGSSLRGKGKEKWVGMMPTLRNGLNKTIEQTLRVSYDGLDDKDDQDLFLCIACFFNGESVNYIQSLLENYIYAGVNTRLRTLADKSLICITQPHETVQMHILLQKLGIKIVIEESKTNPGNRQFLVDAKDISDVFMDKTGTENVIGICLNTSEIDEPLFMDENSFKGMHNLKFLKIDKTWWAQKTGEVKLELPNGLLYLPPKLILLHWNEYPAKYIPSNFTAAHLVKLEMRDSKLEKLWEGTQPLRSLKEMDLYGSEYLKEIPDLSNATNLEILTLTACTSLVTLPSSIRNLKKLRKLLMEGCSNLEVLPTDVNLESLDCLDLSKCSRLRSFPRISRNVSTLKLDGTAMEEEDCLWIENLSRLTKLDWEYCPLRCMPSNFNPEHLVVLEMTESKVEKLWERLQSLRNLETMDLNYCENLKEIPDLSKATNLFYLSFSFCTSLVMLPSSIQHLHKLETLDMTGCTSLEVLPTNINLVSLCSLDLSGCSRLTSFPQISTSIAFLSLDNTGIEEVPSWIKNITGLEELSMEHCKKLRKISATIWNLKHLKRAKFRDCGSLTSATVSLVMLPSSIQHLDKLAELDMRGCTSLEVLPTNINLVSLHYLDLTRCSRLTSFPQISTHIKMLYLDDTGIEEVPSWIENIDGLTDLMMRGCKKLKIISATIWNLKSLGSADFTDCVSLTSISIENYTDDYMYQDADFLFDNCFNLDRDAHEFIVKSGCRVAVLPIKQVPKYFTHRTCGSSLSVPLPQSSLSQDSLGFKACIILDNCASGFFFGVFVHWKFRGLTGMCLAREFRRHVSEMDHLVVFNFSFCTREEVDDPPSQLDCNNVEFEFEIHRLYMCRCYSDLGTKDRNLLTCPILHNEIKGCGVRVVSVSPSMISEQQDTETLINCYRKCLHQEKPSQPADTETPYMISEQQDTETLINCSRPLHQKKPSQPADTETDILLIKLARSLQKEKRSQSVETESERSNKRMQTTVITSQEHSNIPCGQTEDTRLPAPNLDLSYGVSSNFHGNGTSLYHSLPPNNPCLEEEALYVEEQDTETLIKDPSSSTQLINFSRLLHQEKPSQSVKTDTERSNNLMRMTVITSQQHSNIPCVQTEDTGLPALNLDVSLGLCGVSGNFHGNGTPLSPYLEIEASCVDPMITEQQDTETLHCGSFLVSTAYKLFQMIEVIFRKRSTKPVTAPTQCQ